MAPTPSSFPAQEGVRDQLFYRDLAALIVDPAEVCRLPWVVNTRGHASSASAHHCPLQELSKE